MAGGDGEASSNGASRGVSNGSRAPPQTLPVASTNGTHKAASLSSANGSSRHNVKETAKEPSSNYFGHDREEVTRILIQALGDMGYQSAAESVSKDSGFELESPTVASFRTAVLGGDWAEAEKLLFGAATASDVAGNGLVLAQGADRDMMRFWVRQQKYLEALEKQDTRYALIVLRTELTPLNQDTQKIPFLSGLLMCDSADELKSKADWDGADGKSRQVLLSELSKCISPSVMLPERRLAVLFDQVKEGQIRNCIYHTSPLSPSLYSDHVCDRDLFPTQVICQLDKQNGEVWQLRFSHDGQLLASCGADSQVFIWDIGEGTFERILTLDAHVGGTGNIAWSPDDSMLVSCGRDHSAKLWDTHNGALLRQYSRFDEPVSCCVWAADGQSIILGSFDKENALCQYNLHGVPLHLWTKKYRTEDLAMSQDGHWLVAMDHEKHIYVYNFLTRELEWETSLDERPTSLSITRDSRYLLINKNDGEAQLFDIAARRAVNKYTGHKGGDFLIRSDFGGADESFIISGSEDGFVYIWHKTHSDAIARLDGHRPRCNAVAWNPANPVMFASCGDDAKIKIWSN